MRKHLLKDDILKSIRPVGQDIYFKCCTKNLKIITKKIQYLILSDACRSLNA